MGKAKRMNTYDAEVSNSRRVIEEYALARQKRSVGTSYRGIPFTPRPSPGGGGVISGAIRACPIICCENDLGAITSATNIDWSISNFHRCVVGADIQFTMINLPVAGDFQTLVLEIKQDGTGNRAITFADSFLNSHLPTINLAANGVTTLAFYTYDDGTDRILGFNTIPSIPLMIALSDEKTKLNQTSTTVPMVTFRMPGAFTLTDVRASLTNASSNGLLTIGNIKDDGIDIISTSLTIDQGELTSTTAATPVVIANSAIADDSEITVFLTNAGQNATGLKLYMIGYQA